MRSASQLKRVSTAVVVAIAGAALGSAAFGQAGKAGGNGGQAAEPVRLNIAINGTSERFLVASADAAESAAVLLQGANVTAPGYTLYSRVLVKSGDVELVRKISTGAGGALLAEPPEVVASTDVPGWTIVEASSVREAAAIAERLRESGLFKSITVDRMEPRQNYEVPSDPLVDDQWHLLNTDNPDSDLNVSQVYAMGITGAGVTVGVLEAFDESFKQDHPDLAANWNQAVSMDLHPFATPAEQLHPTEVAGLIAAVANNGEGVAGVAYGADLAQLRNGSNLIQARAIQWFYNVIDVQSNSWGPGNPPGQFPAHVVSDYVMDALARSVKYGRGGKGGIYLFSAGNDGPVDRTDYQPLHSSRLTLAIGGVLENGLLAGYSSTGTSVFASTFTGPSVPPPDPVNRGITTTGVDQPETLPDETYVSDFNGTSASCPIAAGVVALMLEANPALTYRDVQHILADTSVPINYTNGSAYYPFAHIGGNTWWQVNGAFTRHSDQYGFGLIDAEAAVTAALGWTPVQDQMLLDTFFVPIGLSVANAEFVETPPESGEYIIVPGSVTIPFCVRSDMQIEAIEVTVSATGGWVGDLEILLGSPWGSFSPLAIPRPDAGNYTRYVFTTFKHWDEMSAGEWSLSFTDYIPDGPFDVDGATVDLAPYGLDGIDGAGEKELVEYRVQIYGTHSADAEFYLCDPLGQGCPGDINGNGIVDVSDFQMFLDYWYAGDPFADLDGDGNVTYADLQLFLSVWVPGYCDGSGDEGPGGRPMPGGDHGRPIGPGPGGD